MKLPIDLPTFLNTQKSKPAIPLVTFFNLGALSRLFGSTLSCAVANVSKEVIAFDIKPALILLVVIFITDAIPDAVLFNSASISTILFNTGSI